MVQEDVGGERTLDAAHRFGRLLLGSAGKQDDELLAAVARTQVGRPDPRAQQPGQVAQRVVAGLVAERVVQALEVVHVEQRE